MKIDFARIAAENGLRAVAVIGSRARGDYTPHSDLDLVGLSDRRLFRRYNEGDMVVELHIAEQVSDWRAKPSWWYALEHVDVKIDDGTLAGLPSLVAAWRREYRPLPDDVRRNRDWLESTVRKLRGAGTDTARAFLLATNLWEMLSGAFIAKGMPVPASSDMLRLGPDVVGKERFETLLSGALDARQEEALRFCEEIIAAHNGRPDVS